MRVIVGAMALSRLVVRVVTRIGARFAPPFVLLPVMAAVVVVSPPAAVGALRPAHGVMRFGAAGLARAPVVRRKRVVGRLLPAVGSVGAGVVPTEPVGFVPVAVRRAVEPVVATDPVAVRAVPVRVVRMVPVVPVMAVVSAMLVVFVPVVPAGRCPRVGVRDRVLGW